MQEDINNEIDLNAVSENNPFKEKTAEEILSEANKAQAPAEEQANEEPKVETAEPEEPAKDNGEVEKIKQDFEKLNNTYLRLAADFDNYRKRQAQERENLINYGKTEALTKLIEVLDNFDRAEQSIKDTEDAAQVKEAFGILHKQITDSLERVGLTVIETVGKEFDPNVHEAVMQTPSTEHPDQTIIAELQKGYKLGDKVLRASLVNVATN